MPDAIALLGVFCGLETAALGGLLACRGVRMLRSRRRAPAIHARYMDLAEQTERRNQARQLVARRQLERVDLDELHNKIQRTYGGQR